jgi:hypothetical protein
VGVRGEGVEVGVGKRERKKEEKKSERKRA